jgi:fatty-acyl-CoA synthase
VATVNTFAEVVRARAGDGNVGVVFGPERHTWGSVVQEAADRAAADILSRYRGADLPAAPPSLGAILLLLFSSGSTGAPKAVICPQSRFGMLARTMQQRTELTRDSVSYLSMAAPRCCRSNAEEG